MRNKLIVLGNLLIFQLKHFTALGTSFCTRNVLSTRTHIQKCLQNRLPFHCNIRCLYALRHFSLTIASMLTTGMYTLKSEVLFLALQKLKSALFKSSHSDCSRSAVKLHSKCYFSTWTRVVPARPQKSLTFSKISVTLVSLEPMIRWFRSADITARPTDISRLLADRIVT